MRLVVSLGLAVVFFAVSETAFSFDPKKDHPMLTDLAFEFAMSQGFLTPLLAGLTDFDETVRLGIFEDGIPPEEYDRFTKIGNNSFGRPTHRRPKLFAMTGSVAEDYPSVPFEGMNPFNGDPLYMKLGSRAAHHFHDPGRYPRRGLDNRDATMFADFYRDWIMKNLGDLRGISSANRALDSAFPPFDGEAYRAAVPANLFDWADARRYFLAALTSTAELTRSHYYALTFLALGHVMHLAEDAAVPAHSRNDFLVDHLYVYSRPFVEDRNFEEYVQAWRLRTTDSLPLGLVAPFGSVSPSAIWDTDGGPGKGLSQYAHDGFLSKGTMAQADSPPDIRELDGFVEQGDDGYFRLYYPGITADGERIAHLARYSLLAHLERELRGASFAEIRKDLHLDNRCYSDYADLLLPRAVAASADVLKHFFRGRLSVSVEIGGLAISNLGSEVLSGIFTVHYQPLAPRGTRRPLPGASWTLSIPPGDRSVIEEPIPLPEDFTPNSPLLLVFSGRMGSESDAVAATRFNYPNLLYIWDLVYENYSGLRRLDQHVIGGSSPHSDCNPSWRIETCSRTFTGSWGRYSILRAVYDPRAGRPIPLWNGLHHFIYSEYDCDDDQCRTEWTTPCPELTSGARLVGFVCPGGMTTCGFSDPSNIYVPLMEREPDREAVPNLLGAAELDLLLKEIHPRLHPEIPFEEAARYAVVQVTDPPLIYDWESREYLDWEWGDSSWMSGVLEPLGAARHDRVYWPSDGLDPSQVVTVGSWAYGTAFDFTREDNTPSGFQRLRRWYNPDDAERSLELFETGPPQP
jgi:hypothetical protein